jgi:oligosaccharide repeat unit polymerase
MTFVSLVFLLGCVLILLTNLRKGADYLSPVKVMGLTWCGAIGLADLKLSAFQHSWSLGEWVVVLLGPASFLIGVYLAFIVNLDKRILPLQEIRHRLRAEPVYERRLFALIIFGFALYAMAYLTIYLVKGFIPAFSPNAADLRKEFSVFGVGVLLNSMPFLLFFIFYYHMRIADRRWQKHILKCVGIISFVTYTLLLQRFQIVMAAVMSFSMFYYLSRRIRIRTVLGAISGTVVFFYYISTLRAGQLISYYLYSTSRMRFSYRYALFTEPYMYLVMNLENLARAATRVESYTFGYYTFDFVFALTGLKHWLSDYLRLEETPFLVSGYNTYTAFWTFYRDFGPLGITIVPLLMGLVIGCTYYALRRDPSLRFVTAYAVMVFVMIFSFFNSPIGYLWFAYNAFFMILIVQWVSVPKWGASTSPPVRVNLA